MKVQNKNIYRSLILTSFVGILALIIFGIGQTLSYLNTGADRSSMLKIAIDKTQVYLPKIDWKDTINPGRPIEKQTLKDIQKDYANAWYIRQAMNLKVHSTTTDHDLSLDFYSADGQLAVITDKNVKEYQQVYDDDGFIMETEQYSDYQTLLLLEDGYWRIRHMVRKNSMPIQDTTRVKPFAIVKDENIYIENEAYRVKGINYYPQKSPWDMFGDQFDIETISKDLDIIKNAGLNTIRIFVQYEDFGKNNVSLTKLAKLKEVLDQAKTKDIKVIVTLFDFYGDYSVLDWTITHRHVEQIVSAFKNHSAILAWDVKNEPNLDFESRGKEKVLAWLKEMIFQIKKYDPNHLITIGWSDITSASILKNTVDVVSFHYYDDIDSLEERYLQLKSSSKKPLVLQEFGLSSNIGFWNPFGSTERRQASYHKKIQAICKEQNIHYMSWTLYDFQEVPGSVVGNLPWRRQKQRYFGFIDTEGNKKKAFDFISE